MRSNWYVDVESSANVNLPQEERTNHREKEEESTLVNLAIIPRVIYESQFSFNNILQNRSARAVIWLRNFPSPLPKASRASFIRDMQIISYINRDSQTNVLAARDPLSHVAINWELRDVKLTARI